ncbi:MAG TPA: dynamin family protein [Bacillota bacterium]|nr:dynamin family protein [Bacillota bacterium]
MPEDQMLNDMPNEAMWNSTLRRYKLTEKTAKKLAEHNNITFPAGFLSSMDAFMQRCANNDFHIALVGAIKAGKSTLINALFDRELASTSVTPETASLTKFRSSKGKDYIKISFYNAEEWAELWKSAEDANAKVFIEEFQKLWADDEKGQWVGHPELYTEYENEAFLKEDIKKWTSSKSAPHYFVKEVEVGLQRLDIPRQIVYVDTPGLDDPVEFRSNITRNYIYRANAVLVCVRAAVLTGPELKTIYQVFENTRHNPGKVFVLGTQIDALNDIEDEWREQKKLWLKHLSGENYFNNKDLAEKNLLGTAAYLHTLLKNNQNNSLDHNEKKILMSTAVKLDLRVDYTDDQQKLMDLCNIEALRNRINREILTDPNRLMLLDIKEMYQKCKMELYNSYTKLTPDPTKLMGSNMDEICKQITERRILWRKQQPERMDFDKFISDFNLTAQKRANELFPVIKSFR